MKKTVLISGTANKEFALKLAKRLKTRLIGIESRKFSDSETYVRITERLKGKNVVIAQSLNKPVNENLMELILLIDAARQAGAGKITLALPYMAYTRQERICVKGEPVSIKAVIRMLEAVGMEKMVTLELHADNIKKFFKVPLIHLESTELFADYLKKKKLNNICIVAPDKGALKKAGALAKLMNAEAAVMTKKRPRQEKVKMTGVKGNVKGKNCVIIDDLINTGGTISMAVKALRKKGAKNVFVIATHGIFANNGLKKILKSEPKEIVITDSISQKNKPKKLRVLSTTKLFAEAVESN